MTGANLPSRSMIASSAASAVIERYSRRPGIKPERRQHDDAQNHRGQSRCEVGGLLQGLILTIHRRLSRPFLGASESHCVTTGLKRTPQRGTGYASVGTAAGTWHPSCPRPSVVGRGSPDPAPASTEGLPASGHSALPSTEGLHAFQVGCLYPTLLPIYRFLGRSDFSDVTAANRSRKITLPQSEAVPAWRNPPV